jgi:anti-sigma-K factor RskA
MTRDHDIVDYLLGELDPQGRARVEERMRDDPAFRDEVEHMRPVVADLEALPGEAWGAGEAVPALPPLPPLPPPPPLSELEERRARRRLPVRPAYAVAASIAVLLIGVAIGAVVTHRGADDGPAIALARIDQGGPAAAGTARFVSSGGGQLRVQVDGLAPSSTHDFYEVWLMDGPGVAMSIGTFRVPASGHASVTMPLPVPVTDFGYIDVSKEPEDGNAAHSAHSVLRGPTTA